MYNEKTNKHHGWIYLICNYINDYKYVGQTRVSVDSRWKQHKYSYKNKQNIVLYKAFNKYGVDNFEVKTIEEVFADTEKDLIIKLNEREIYYISLYDCQLPNGYNMTRGGDSIREYNEVPVDAYDASGKLIHSFNGIVEASKFIGYNYESSNISLCCKGKRRYAFGYIWRYHTDDFDKFPSDVTQQELDADNRCISIDQYTKDGVFIKTFNSMVEAAISCGDINNSHISECCKGDLHTAYGYVWRYHGDKLNLEKHVNKNNIPVNQYTLDGEFVKSHKNMADGYRYLGLSTEKRGNIGRCCNGQRKSYYGYKWFYANDPNQPDKTKIA